MSNKRRIGFFGNCQADQFERILAKYGPLTDKFDVVPVKPVYMMTVAERQLFLDCTVPSLDVIVTQHIGDAYKPSTTENILKCLKLNAEVIYFPSIWFDAHIPDIFWMHAPTGLSVPIAPATYHSRLIAHGYTEGLSVAEVAERFGSSDFYDPNFLDSTFQSNMEALSTREKSCDLVCVDFIADGFDSRCMLHTMNHPDISVLFWLMQQLMKILGVEALPDNLRAKYAHALAEIKWPIAASVREHFAMKFRRDQLILGGVPVTAAKFTEMYFEYYRANDALVDAHRQDLRAWFERATAFRS